MDLEIKSKVAVVLAASKGLGKATAKALAAEGCKVAICSRDEEKIKAVERELQKEYKIETLSYVADLQYKDEIEAFILAVKNRWGQIDILINNAGGPPVASFEDSEDEEWLKWYNITFMSVTRTIKAALPMLKKSGQGRIINITSASVKAPIENLIYSNAIRLAVIGLAKSLSIELGVYGITVHNVAPGYHLTDGLERIVKKRVESGEEREKVLQTWAHSIPVKRIGKAEELAALVAFWASGKAGYMTGTTIQVDGGRTTSTL